MKFSRCALASVVALFVFSCSASDTLALATDGAAGVVSISGDIEFIDPPASLMPGDFGGSEKIALFAEQQEVVISEPILLRGGASGIPLDHDGSPGFFERISDQRPAQLPSGAKVNSHYLAYRPFDVLNPVVPIESRAASGIVTFESPIVGLFTANESPDLESVNRLFALEEVLYPVSGGALELAPEANLIADSYAISADRRTLEVNLRATTNIDRIRVLTLVVPEPSSLALALAIAVCTGFMARRPWGD